MQIADPRTSSTATSAWCARGWRTRASSTTRTASATLEARVPGSRNVVYHNKLGSQLERVERMRAAGRQIARDDWRRPMRRAERAAWLSKADLVTDMVGEFPELQGIMGRYYALHDGEARGGRRRHRRALPAALRRRRAARRRASALRVALADKLDTLAGLFGIGQQPTGDKDPFAPAPRTRSA